MAPLPKQDQVDPEPVLRIHFNEIKHPATATFFTLIDCAKILPNSIKNVVRHLYAPYEASKVPETRSVTLVLRSKDGVAYTTGLEIDDLHKEIHMSLEHIENHSHEPLRCRDEIIGVITHEMVHCYQWTCLGTAPGGLIEGIADFVRLRSGLAPPHWKSAKDEVGDRWDNGYQKTAYFLDWLEQTHGTGTIAKMNETMRTDRYDEKKFWTGLFGEKSTIDVLWETYKKSFEDSDEDDASTRTEPVLVDLSEKEKSEADEEQQNGKA